MHDKYFNMSKRISTFKADAMNVKCAMNATKELSKSPFKGISNEFSQWLRKTTACVLLVCNSTTQLHIKLQYLKLHTV